jgi:putative FmdB family regulatory protein
MPTYDYECIQCGHQFEVFQKINDKPRSRCPECKGKVRRLISPGSGLIFKGKGFYATDYKRKPSQPGAEGKPDKPCTGCGESSCPAAEKK